jgi:hypothetical protein
MGRLEGGTHRHWVKAVLRAAVQRSGVGALAPSGPSHHSEADCRSTRVSNHDSLFINLSCSSCSSLFSFGSPLSSK